MYENQPPANKATRETIVVKIARNLLAPVKLPNPPALRNERMIKMKNPNPPRETMANSAPKIILFNFKFHPLKIKFFW